ncbi:MAG: 4-diphosphocytidyl-2C-methyl-D-erythritol kinase [Alphaproteobacteria bacterium]|nr:4-diphosphocytidyl-2C-methyl-D-erythritol kinase [Alphaproteobacteria bacterium]
MDFGRIALETAEGTVLGHSIKLARIAFKKGRVLSADDVAQLRASGLTHVIAARYGQDDVPEDEAALAVAGAACGEHARRNAPFTGRCNLYADTPGVLLIDRERLDRLNLVDESITVATLAPFDLVEQGQMLATVKIIPFAAPRAALARCLAIAREGGPLVKVAPLVSHRVGLVLTTLPGVKPAMLDKTVHVLRERLGRLGSAIAEEVRCPHETEAVAKAIRTLLANGCAPILIYGASAIVDRRDVIPAGIVTAGGVVDHFGMPVDPGNLLLLGRHGKTAVVGLPGCARSPKLNGFDWVLWRLLADVPVGRDDVMRMGAGGLLKDLPTERGASRDRDEDDQGGVQRVPRIAAIILAAGQSRRMGRNKLVTPVGGVPMVSRVVDAVERSQAGPTIVVTGHDAEKVREALLGRALTFVHNPEYAAGLSTSLKAGIAALPEDCDGAIVVLGDMPAIRADHLDRLIAAFNPVEGRAICVPTNAGKRGNPVLCGREFFAEMKDIAGDVGAKHLLGQHPDRVCEVAVDDDAVLVDVDTPEALTAFAARQS